MLALKELAFIQTECKCTLCIYYPNLIFLSYFGHLYHHQILSGRTNKNFLKVPVAGSGFTDKVKLLVTC